jgi:hypothetical protein
VVDLLLLAIAAVLILASPHPVVGIVGGVLVYCSVGFRMWAETKSAAVKWRKARYK